MIQIHNIQITITGATGEGYEAQITGPQITSVIGEGDTDIDAMRDLFDNIWSETRPKYDEQI